MSRATVYRLIDEGKIETGRRLGDRRTYLLFDDLQSAREIRPVAPKARTRKAGR